MYDMGWVRACALKRAYTKVNGRKIDVITKVLKHMPTAFNMSEVGAAAKRPAMVRNDGRTATITRGFGLVEGTVAAAR